VSKDVDGSFLQRALKRSLDVVLALLALALLSPLLLLLAALVKLDSPGPVLYRATRVGYRGRQLRMVKFRKMTGAGTGRPLTVAGDARLTRVGSWLERTKLDELPQLWHVLRGEMSLVGPRPEAPEFVGRFPSEYGTIVRVRPGLTGYTQLAFAHEGEILEQDDPERHYVTALLPQKVALDLLYADRLSLRRDAAILAATLATLVLRQPVAVDRASGALTRRRRRDDAASPPSAEPRDHDGQPPERRSSA
jgi:lipopolysaccharide/colanic/teichoic acid biosynthesis glycosyltransferase